MFCCSRSLGLMTVGGLFAAVLAAATAAPASQASSASPKRAASPGAPADEFAIDPVHSSVIFRIQHMGVSFFHGRFDRIEGKFTLDTEEPANSSVEVSIQADSIDTNNAKRDSDVRGPDLLNASEFPAISFKSDKVKALEDGQFEVFGQFTLHGETKPLTVQVEQTGAGKAPHGDGKMVGFETTFTIKRSDYGMDAMLGMLGDEVRLTIAVEGHSK